MDYGIFEMVWDNAYYPIFGKPISWRFRFDGLSPWIYVFFPNKIVSVDVFKVLDLVFQKNGTVLKKTWMMKRDETFRQKAVCRKIIEISLFFGTSRNLLKFCTMFRLCITFQLQNLWSCSTSTSLINGQLSWPTIYWPWHGVGITGPDLCWHIGILWLYHARVRIIRSAEWVE